jgi:hypothetical protein
MVLKQRQMPCDVFRAPKSWSFRPGQAQGRNPKRTGDGTHECHAIGCKPRHSARIERLLRARLVAFIQFSRGNIKTAQNLKIIRLRTMQTADPKARDVGRHGNIFRAALFRQGDPGSHPDGPGARVQRTRTRGRPQLTEDKSVHAKSPRK